MNWEFVELHLDKDWDWCKLSEHEHPNITWDIINNNLDKPWELYCLSSNPNVNWKIIHDNPNIDFVSNLIYNKMYRHPHFYSESFRKRQWHKFWSESMEEFIARSWHPDRVNRGWCLDEDDKKEERLAFYGIK